MEITMESRLFAIEQLLHSLVTQSKRSVSDFIAPTFFRKVSSLIDEKLDGITKDYLDTAEACRYLGVSKSTLYKKNYVKAIPFTKAGKKVYYKKSDLEDYITQNRFASEQQLEQLANSYLRN